MNKLFLLLILASQLVLASAQGGDELQQQLSKLQQSISQANNKTQTQTTTQATAQVATTAQPAAASQTPTTQQQITQFLPAGTTLHTIQREGDDLESQAFSHMTQTLLPLTPQQIHILHALYSANQHAASLPPGIPPKPISTSVAVNLSPGATPPIVRLGHGYVSSLVFLDSTGAPWQISAYSVGNPRAFNIQWDKKSNVLLVQAITGYRRGNIAVMLRGLNTPVMLEFMPGQRAMDVRVDVRVPGLGPDAKPTLTGLPSPANPVLLSLLDGIPPNGSSTLNASVCQNCVWLYQGRMYLRTRMDVLSPAWIATVSSGDGTHVYEMQPTPVVLASVNGKTIKMIIKGF